MLFSQNRDQLRQFYCDVWRRHRAGEALEPLEVQVRDVILMHPEYQPLLERPDAALGRDYLPELGETNPFLHMGLHLALHEQVATDRPAGVRALAQRLRLAQADGHALEHRMMDCLAEAIWRGQRDNAAPDEGEYLRCLERLLQR
ncbi:MAG: DUF1841 family protein [Gammaproteobacteria bacterium]|nr:DUF1841 family protein [Gammaproteobacteria bacterium]